VHYLLKNKKSNIFLIVVWEKLKVNVERNDFDTDTKKRIQPENANFTLK